MGLFKKNEYQWVNKGLSYAKKRDYKEAIGCFTQAIEINPSLPEAHYNLGVCLHDLGEPEAALECFNEAIKLNPREDKAWYNKGTCLDTLGKYDEALTCFDKAIEINPRYYKAYNNRGVILKRFDELDKALKQFKHCVGIEPAFIEALYNRATTLQELGQHKEAVSWFNILIDRINDEVSLNDMFKAMKTPLGFLSPTMVYADYRSNARKLKALSEDVLELEADTDEELKKREISRQFVLQYKEALPLYLRGLNLMQSGMEAKAIEKFKRFLEISPPENHELNREVESMITELEDDDYD